MCKYCEPYKELCINGKKGFACITKYGEIVVFPNFGSSSVKLKINFCPMCGAKLGNNNNKEFKKRQLGNGYLMAGKVKTTKDGLILDFGTHHNIIDEYEKLCYASLVEDKLTEYEKEINRLNQYHCTEATKWLAIDYKKNCEIKKMKKILLNYQLNNLLNLDVEDYVAKHANSVHWDDGFVIYQEAVQSMKQKVSDAIKKIRNKIKEFE